MVGLCTNCSVNYSCAAQGRMETSSAFYNVNENIDHTWITSSVVPRFNALVVDTFSADLQRLVGASGTALVRGGGGGIHGHACEPGENELWVILAEFDIDLWKAYAPLACVKSTKWFAAQKRKNSSSSVYICTQSNLCIYIYI